MREEHQGARAIVAAEQFEPDILLLDVCMPDMDGGEVAFQFKGHRRLRRLPIIFFTSIVSEHDAAAGTAFTSSGFRFLPKTVTLDALRDCIEEEIGSSRS